MPTNTPCSYLVLQQQETKLEDVVVDLKTTLFLNILVGLFQPELFIYFKLELP